MPSASRDDPERRWADAERELTGVRVVGRARRTAALVVTVVWAVLLVVLLVAIVLPAPSIGRSTWQIAAAGGLVLLGVIAALRGAATTPGALLRRVAPTSPQRRTVRRQLAGRETAPAGHRAVLDALAREDAATGLLLLAAIVTYYLGYLAGVRADGSASAAVGLPLVTLVFAALAIVPVRRMVTAAGHRRRGIARGTPREP